MSESNEQSRELMRRITAEIWDEGRLDLIDEYIAEELIDHIEVPASKSSAASDTERTPRPCEQRSRTFRTPLDLIVADGDIAVSYGRIVGTNTGEMIGHTSI